MQDENVALHWKLYGIINGLWWIGGCTVYASNSYFAERLRCSFRSISKALAKLEELKLSRKEIKDRHTRTILPATRIEQIGEEVRTLSSGGYEPQVQGGMNPRFKHNSIRDNAVSSMRPTSGPPQRASTYRDTRHSDDLEPVIDADTGERLHSRAFTALPTLDVLLWAEKRMGHKFPTQPKQKAAIAKMFDAGYTADAIRACWERLEKDEFWSGRGFDFGIVLNEIGKSRPNAGGRTGMKFENGMLTRYRDGKIISQEKLK